jgi:hypothetical protein
MSTRAHTKVFGLKIPVRQNVLAGALGVVAALVIWYNLRSSDDSEPVATVPKTETASNPAPPTMRRKPRTDRRTGTSSDRGTLKIKPVDASDGRIDPTLRTDLIARLQSVTPVAGGRSLFESGPAAAQMAMGQLPNVKVPVGPKPNPGPVTPVILSPSVNIPLRYFGFVHPAARNDFNRGLFMDGDNILIAKEGEELEGKYLVVELNANSARMEDTQLRQGQTLPVTPEASIQ